MKGIREGGPVLAALASAFVIAALLAAAGVSPPSARADSAVTVTGNCTLAKAVAYADGTSELDCAPGHASGTTTIHLPAGTYTLSATLALTADTIIDGAGAASTTISGNDSVEVLNVAAGVTAAVNGVTISHGRSAEPSLGCTGPCDGSDGGGILNAGNLTLTGDSVTANAAAAGVMYTALTGCPFVPCPGTPGVDAGHGGHGGGIFNDGTLIVNQSTISGNSAGDGGPAGAGFSGIGVEAGAGQPGGNGGYGGSGGGIFNGASGSLTVRDSTIADNHAGSGGAAGAGSNALVSNSPGGAAGTAGDGGSGGGIFSEGTVLSITGSSIHDNSAGNGGPGASGGTGSGTAVSGSSSPGGNAGWAGGVYVYALGPATLTDVTVSGNAAPAGGAGTGLTPAGQGGPGGGIVEAHGALALSFVTVAHNSAAGSGGGVADTGGTTTETASVIASNTGSPQNCSASGITDGGYNVVFGDFSCPGSHADPKLGTLADNGGPTQTMALGPGSAATDLVPAAHCTPASDQRGVSRPQGAACDAGAYEFAPPSVTGASGAATSSSTATVAAAVDPDAGQSDTTVSVEYGTTTAYGATTPAQDVGRGTAPVPVSAALSGLAPGSTYHFAVVARNSDGSTISGDGTFATPSAPAATTSTPSTSTQPGNSATSGGAASAALSALPAVARGAAVTLEIACSGGAAGSACSGTLALSSHVTTQGRRLVAINALPRPERKSKPRAKPVTRVETVGGGSYSVPAGQTQRVTLALNATGRRLLAARYQLPTTLTMSGALTGTRKLTFQLTVLRARVSAGWSVGPRGTVVRRLALSSVPRGANVRAGCHGGGCPFSSRTFKVTHGAAELTAAFSHARLAPGATVELAVTHSGDVGQVSIYTMAAGSAPKLTMRCLVPGAGGASPCVR